MLANRHGRVINKKCARQYRLVDFWSRYEAANAWRSIHRQAIHTMMILQQHRNANDCWTNNNNNKQHVYEEAASSIGGGDVIYCATTADDDDESIIDEEEEEESSDSLMVDEETNEWTNEQDIMGKGEEQEQEEEEEESEEVDEQLAEFLKQSAEHRRQRDAERMRTNQSCKKDDYWLQINGEDYILADKIDIEGASNRTIATPNVAHEEQNKREQRKQLYGSRNALKIAAMEMAMQVQYEQHIAKTDAQLWPVIPLKI